MTLESKLLLLLGYCSCKLHQSCLGANMVYSWAEHVFILKHYFTSKSFAAIHEAISKAYPDKEVLNKTTIHQLVTELWESGSVCNRKYIWRQTVLTDEATGNRIVGIRKCLQQEIYLVSDSVDRWGTASFNMMGHWPTLWTQLLYCKSSLVRALLGVALGNCDLQTLPCQTSFCGDFWKKVFILIPHRAWRNCQHWLRNTLQSRIKHAEKSGRLFPRRWWTFSASAVKLFCKLFLTNKTKKQLVCLIILMSPKFTNTVVARVVF
jgi:hypothetical protein